MSIDLHVLTICLFIYFCILELGSKYYEWIYNSDEIMFNNTKAASSLGICTRSVIRLVRRQKDVGSMMEIKYATQKEIAGRTD